MSETKQSTFLKPKCLSTPLQKAIALASFNAAVLSFMHEYMLSASVVRAATSTGIKIAGKATSSATKLLNINN